MKRTEKASLINEDYRVGKMTFGACLKGLFTGHTFYLVASQRLGNWLYRHKVRFLPDLIKCWQLRKFACELSPYATIGGGLSIPHSTGIVVGHAVQIGSHCRIFQNVTIGSNEKTEDRTDMPKIGNHVTIYAGAVLVGGIEIGDHAVIGANAVVTKDVPPHAVVTGNPMKIVEPIKDI